MGYAAITDWAAETVMEILNKWGTDDDIYLDKLCDALRKAKADGSKAKADGLREAAETCRTKAQMWDDLGFVGSKVSCLDLANILAIEASKLDPPAS